MSRHHPFAPKTYKLRIGSKAQVYHGTALKTSEHSRLRQKDFMQTPSGKIVRKKRSQASKKTLRSNPQLKALFKRYQFQ